MKAPGTIFVVGIGPGARSAMSPEASDVLARCQVIIGYSGYLALLSDLTAGKECHGLALGEERERARLAITEAGRGKNVAVVSSGDPGIYGMAGIVLELAEQTAESPEVVIVPGVSAVNAAAALLGAPLGHDFAVISLSDLWTPWESIARRLAAAAEADFVIALLNPKSRQRDWQLNHAQDILLRYREPTTPVGIVRQAYRPEQSVRLSTLADLGHEQIDMFTTVIVGSSQTRPFQSKMFTPRGFRFIASRSHEREAMNRKPQSEVEPPHSKEIIDKSFGIIEREIGEHKFSPEEWPIVRRMIHATGDLDLAGLVVFRNEAVTCGQDALRRGLPIVVDVKMVAAGINRPYLDSFESRMHCFIDDPERRDDALAKGTTRSYSAMRRAVARFPEAVFVIGNAPTALTALSEAVEAGEARPGLVLAMPVGFVGVLESKKRAMNLDVPLIAVEGRKGGSAVAAAAMNALLIQAAGECRP